MLMSAQPAMLHLSLALTGFEQKMANLCGDPCAREEGHSERNGLILLEHNSVRESRTVVLQMPTESTLFTLLTG